MALPEVITKTLNTAAKLKGGTSGNEANTKALLIEPMLAALGWDPVDLDVVEREVKVFAGTFLDYALKIANAPRLYVEAKGVAENLDDNKFVAQTVNYANNDGVLWCVLSNGLRWRVYKTNEPVAMDQKLLFEVDLADESESPNEKAKILRLVSREAVDAGDLDRFGDRIFTDTRVRKALANLAGKPPPAFLDAVASRLDPPEVSTTALQKSLGRILNADIGAGKASETVGGTGHKTPVGPSEPPKGQDYSLDHHLQNKGSLIRDLFQDLDTYTPTLGPDVSRRIRKYYIGYFRGKKSFCTVETQQNRLIVYLSLPPVNLKPWNEEAMRDVRKIGHFGMGDTEYSLRTTDQLDEAKSLMKRAYEAGG